MKTLKILISFVIVISLFALSVDATPIYNASLDFNTFVNSAPQNGEKIYVHKGDNLKLDLVLKTNQGYYAGPLAAQIFYSNSFFTDGELNLNTNGSFYNCCKTYTDVAAKADVSDSLMSRLYPSTWKQDKRDSYDFHSINMVPTALDCKNTPDSLNDVIASLTFTVPSLDVGSIGEVIIPPDALKTETNPIGATYIACYTNGGDVLSDRCDYGNEIKIDVNGASALFEITDIGDVDLNGRVTSADALLIMQFITALCDLTPDEQARANITNAQRLTSSDALAALQIAVGIKQINDFLNK